MYIFLAQFYAAGYPGVVFVQNVCQKDVHSGTHFFIGRMGLNRDFPDAQSRVDRE